MAITYGTVTATTLSSSWDGSKFVATQSHTLAAGSTQIAVAIHGLTIGSLTVKWGSTTLTSRGDISDGNAGRVRIYDLDAPTSGTANVVVESGIHDMTGSGITIVGVSGVDSGTPRRTAGTATAYSGTASVGVTTVAGDSVLGFVSTVNSATIDGSMTALNSNLLAVGEYGSLGYKDAVGTSTTVQWTQTAEQWCIAAIPYVPASGDTTAPVLTSPVANATAATTATVGATTDEANGTLYSVITTSSTQPSVAQIKAGQNHLGASATWSGNQAISSTGAKTFSVTGLTAGTMYFTYTVHADAAGNNSNVVASGFAAYSVSAASVTPATQSVALNATGSFVYTLNVTPVSVTPVANVVALTFSTPVPTTTVVPVTKNIVLAVTLPVTRAQALPLTQSVALNFSGVVAYTLNVTPASPTIAMQDVALNPSYPSAGGVGATTGRRNRRYSYALKYFSRG